MVTRSDMDLPCSPPCCCSGPCSLQGKGYECPLAAGMTVVTALMQEAERERESKCVVEVSCNVSYMYA